MSHTEDEFQSHIDARPDDYFAKGVFADWLEEQGDERAEGYRAMLACGLHGANGAGNEYVSEMTTCWFPDTAHINTAYTEVPADWYDALGESGVSSGLYTEDYPDRRAAEDALARAFTKFPEDRRRELLAGKRVSSLSPTATTHSS